MSDYEIRNAREWDAASSQLSSSRLSDGTEDGFTTVQRSKAKKHDQRRGGPPTRTSDPRVSNTQGPTPSYRSAPVNGPGIARGTTRRGRGGATGHKEADTHQTTASLPHRLAQPTRASTQRPRPTNAAELENQRGHAATAIFSFTMPRKTCSHRLAQTDFKSLKGELGAISRQTATHITESNADSFAVLIWGDESHARQAILRLEDLNRRIQQEKWAKNHAYDGRRETRRELKAHDEEQVARLQLFGESHQYPFEYSFLWPDSELSLADVIDTNDRPRGAFDTIRATCQCSIRFNVASSLIVIQGMQEQDVVLAGRTFEDIARQMIAEKADHIKISLLRVPGMPLHHPFVSMEQTVELKTSLYKLPDLNATVKDTFLVKTPKLWNLHPPPDDVARLRTARLAKRLDRFNRKTLIAGLENRLTNLHFVNKAVRMQVNFGDLAFLKYSVPQPGSGHHSFETFRTNMAKERTDVLLQALPAETNISAVVQRLCQHPAFKYGEEASAPLAESFVVTFDFSRPESSDILHHEQEFCESSKKDEMEVRRKSWVKMGNDSTSPLVLSVLDFVKFDWQLRIDVHDIQDPRHMARDYAEFESGVGVIPTQTPTVVGGPPIQRATWPRGSRGLIRVTNKPVVRLKLGKTDHVLELAREDVYEVDSFQSSSPKPESKVTASFYYSNWANHLGEFAYLKHGERPSWEAALSTFFPEEETSNARSRENSQGPRNFLKEVEEVKTILWEAIRYARGKELEKNQPISQRVGILDSKDQEEWPLAN